MTNIDFSQEPSPIGTGWSRPGIGLGSESEEIQRAAILQVRNNLPDISLQLDAAWTKKDVEFEDALGKFVERVSVPSVPNNNFHTGMKPSLVEAPIEYWPNITAYCHSYKASSSQPDWYDTIDAILCLEVLCSDGPVDEIHLHDEEGMRVEQILDSKLNRLSDAVNLCLKKDPTLGSVLAGPITSPPTSTTSLPWSRTEVEGGTGPYYMFQGKLLEYTVQKNSF